MNWNGISPFSCNFLQSRQSAVNGGCLTELNGAEPPGNLRDKKKWNKSMNFDELDEISCWIKHVSVLGMEFLIHCNRFLSGVVTLSPAAVLIHIFMPITKTLTGPTLQHNGIYTHALSITYSRFTYSSDTTNDAANATYTHCWSPPAWITAN